MEKLPEILLKLEVQDAIEVADKYITFKYVELGLCAFLIIGFISALAISGFFGSKLRF